jgi:hypothetical protein
MAKDRSGNRPRRAGGSPPPRREGGRSRPPKPISGSIPGGSGRGKTHKGPGGGAVGGDCCPMVAALRSVKRGKFRLASRYATWSIRLMMGVA